MSAPTFFVIGAARSGTSTLCELLRHHRDAFVTMPKEPHFLAFAGTQPDFRGPGDDIAINRTAVTDLDDYLRLYRTAGAAAARGEGSVSSLYYESAVATARQHFPDARFVVILRDPAERAFSSFQYLRSRGLEEETDFGRALDLEEQRIADNYHHMWHYTGMSRYGEQLQRWTDAFGRERVLVLFQEEFSREPERVLRAATDFLGIEPYDGDASLRVNSSGEPRPTLFNRMQRRLAGNLVVRRAVRAVVPLRTVERMRTRNMDRVEMPSAERDRLHKTFAADLALLRELLDDRLPDWPSLGPTARPTR